jgi:prepilin-type N-terminal cleavage/methylation domain-containing protein
MDRQPRESSSLALDAACDNQAIVRFVCGLGLIRARTMPMRLRLRLRDQRFVFRRLLYSIQSGESQAAFTLIELLVVVIIIAVLTTIVLPAFLNQQNKARVQAANSLVSDAARACAAMQVSGEQTSYVMPAYVTSDVSGSCPASGSAVVFSTTFASGYLLTNAAAIVATNGSVQMVTCAAAPGVVVLAAPVCSL